MNLKEKLAQIRKKMVIGANEGLEKITDPKTKEAGKAFVETASGLKGMLVSKGTDFLKKYLKENMTEEHPTGATIGAFGEYVVKKSVEKVKSGLEALKDYLENETANYQKLDVIPEIEAIRQLIKEYAQDTLEKGREEINYKGIEIVVNTTEKELSLDLKHQPKTVSVTYLLKDKTISELDQDFGVIAEDLLERLNKLSDPAVLKIEKNATLKLQRAKGEAKYFVNLQKGEGRCEVSYTPEDKKYGVILKYVSEEK